MTLVENENYKELINNFPIAIYHSIHQKNKSNTIMSKLWESWTGYSVEDIYENPAIWMKTIHPKDLKKTTKQFYKTSRNHQDYEIEYRIIHKDSKKVTFVRDHGIFSEMIDDDSVHYNGIITDITEKVKANQKIRESKEREKTLRKFLEESNDGIVLSDINGDIIEWNKGMELITELPKSKVLNKKVWDIMFSNIPSKLRDNKAKTQIESIFKIAATGEAEWFNKIQEIMIETTSKSLKIVQQLPFPIKTPKGIQIGVICRDVSNLKEAENHIKKSEAKFRILFELAPDAIFVIDFNGKFLDVNKQTEIITGYSKEQLIGKSLFEIGIISGDFIKIAKEKLQDLGKGITGDPVEYIVKSKNGHNRPMEVRTYPIENNFIIGIARDVSERKKREFLIEESERNFRELYEEAPNAYFSVLPNQEIRRSNKAAEDLLGYTRRELMSMKVIGLYADTEDGKDKAKKVFQKFISGKPINNEELQMRRKDGTIIWVSLSVKPILDKEGNTIESRSIVIDITKSKIAEERIIESEKKYREAYDRASFYKDLFAHDINNILQIINSSAELISYSLQPSEKSRDIENIASIIKKQVQRGAKLVDNVRTLSKLEEKEILFEKVEIGKLLDKSIDYVLKAYDHRNVNIQLLQKIDKIWVNANEFLQDVFENLLINSVKYNDNKDIKIKIKISEFSMSDKNNLKIEFIDNGIGVPDERKKIIFEPGNRELKGSKGMGLGLSLVKKILDFYHGEIWVENRVENDFTQGSNFIILLPK